MPKPRKTTLPCLMKKTTPKIDLGATEHDHQVTFFDWCALMAKREIPELKLAFAIPNGRHRHISVAKELKSEGVKAGVPDILIPVARNGYHGLFIEMKRPSGHLEAQQVTWLNDLAIQGYFAYCCHSCDEAMELTQYYFGKRTTRPYPPNPR